MTKLALGTAQFGQEYGISNFSGPIKRSEVLEILKSAQEQKIDLNTIAEGVLVKPFDHDTFCELVTDKLQK